MTQWGHQWFIGVHKPNLHFQQKLNLTFNFQQKLSSTFNLHMFTLIQRNCWVERVELNFAQFASLSSIDVVRIVMYISSFSNCCPLRIDLNLLFLNGCLYRRFLSWIKIILFAFFLDFLSLSQRQPITFTRRCALRDYHWLESTLPFPRLSTWTTCLYLTHIPIELMNWIECSKVAASLWSCVQLLIKKTCTRHFG